MDREERVKLLNNILDDSFRYEFTEDLNGDKLFKIQNYYDTDQTIYINIYELSHILKNYTVCDRVLILKDELPEEVR